MSERVSMCVRMCACVCVCSLYVITYAKHRSRLHNIANAIFFIFIFSTFTKSRRCYGVAAICGLSKLPGLFWKRAQFLQGSFAKETWKFREIFPQKSPTSPIFSQKSPTSPQKRPGIFLSLGSLQLAATSHTWKRIQSVLCGNIGFFCGDVGLFCGNIGLFWVYIWLFTNTQMRTVG